MINDEFHAEQEIKKQWAEEGILSGANGTMNQNSLSISSYIQGKGR